MTHDPSEPREDYEWDEATRVLHEQPPHALPGLVAPLDVETKQAIIAQAIARRRAMAPAPAAKPTLLRRLARIAPLAAGLVLAASLTLLLRRPDPLGPVAFDLTPSSALERGQDAEDGHQLSLRNEPGWSARLPEGTDTAALQLYLVARTADGALSVLDAPIDRLNAAFRVTGEVRATGLRPGDTTLYFLVGPRDAGTDALAIVAAFRAGQAVPAEWALRSRDIHITE